MSPPDHSHLPPPLPVARSAGSRLFDAVLPYVPAIMIVVALALLFLMIVVIMDAGNKHQPVPPLFSTKAMDVLILIPLLVGTMAAIGCVLRHQPRPVFSTICLYLGGVLCVLAMIPFALELLAKPRPPTTLPNPGPPAPVPVQTRS